MWTGCYPIKTGSEERRTRRKQFLLAQLGTTKEKNWCETTTFQLDSIKLYIGTQSFSDKAFMNASAVLQWLNLQLFCWLSHLHKRKKTRHNTSMKYSCISSTVKIKIILDSCVIYTLFDISLLFHSDASTFKVAKVTEIGSPRLSYSLYIYIWSYNLHTFGSVGWLLHTDVHETHLTLQESTRFSCTLLTPPTPNIKHCSSAP